jgi:hypothetical protein
VLRGAAAVPVLLGAAACTSPPPPPPPPDPLAELAAAARADAAAARQIAAGVPALAAAAEAVAVARAEHAVVLQREVDRERPPAPSAPSSAPAGSGATPPADAGAARTVLVDGLTAAEKRAAELITSVPRYRAGLVGSVAAGCASLREVLG